MCTTCARCDTKAGQDKAPQWQSRGTGHTCDVTLGCGELVEQLVFQLLELDGELSVLDDELGLGLLKVWTLLVHHQCQQLVLQTLCVFERAMSVVSPIKEKCQNN